MSRQSDKSKCTRFVPAWQLNLRAWKMMFRERPGYFVSNLASSVCEALAPYATILLSARILSELAGSRNPQSLAFWAGMTVAVTALLALAGGALKQWSVYERDSLNVQRFKCVADKMTVMDYAELDRHVDLPAGSPLAFLNSPLSMLLILAAMVTAVLASSACSSKAMLLTNSNVELIREANRYSNFYGIMALEHVRAADLRIYRQQENVCRHYMDSFTARFLGVDGPLFATARGPVGLLMGLSQALSALLTCAVYLFVCLKSWGGAFDVGLVTRYVGSATQLFGGISLLLQTLGEIRANGEFLEVLFRLLDRPDRMYRGSLTTEKRSDRNYQVEFKDVSFRYPGTDRWALRHVNVKFRIGSRLAVVGPNGSGKTTFIKLLCRLYDPTEGEILLNGIDIRKYRYEDYMDIFSVVFQDFRLLALPLGENVAGAADYDRALAEGCLRGAGFGERLDTMPKGLDTVLYRELDQDGVEVSGGEAQKIAIARALYKDAPFIVLDEPTAALDPIAEADIYAKFDAIAGDKTAIYISHRLSSCKFCDEIAVFDRGAIVQTGSHEDLVADEAGLYHRLWQAQAQYYTKE